MSTNDLAAQELGDAVTALIRFITTHFAEIEARDAAIATAIERIEERLIITTHAESPIKKDWYTPTEVARLLGKANYTIREWCRYQRIDARKRLTGRGDSGEWEISADEIERYKNHGLLPPPNRY